MLEAADYTHQNMVAICCFGVPRNSGLSLCSRIQTAAPTRRKKAPVAHHISHVNGFRKAQALELLPRTRVTITSPDSVYGCVKSTILILFLTIAMSPTAASSS